jgi:hypothetical protein
MRKVARSPARPKALPRPASMGTRRDATNRTIGLNDDLYAYLCEHTLRESDLMARLRAETGRLPRGTMQIIHGLAGSADRGAPRARNRHVHRLQRARGGAGASRGRQWQAAPCPYDKGPPTI